MTIALETRGLEKSFGGLKVTRDLSLQVKQGARHALIGPNGAGKTTVINLLTGVLNPNAGGSCSKATTSPTCRFTQGCCAGSRAPSRSTSSMPT